MIVLVHLVYLSAGNFLMNGLLHLLMGLLGKRFVKRPKTVTQRQYDKIYAGKSFSSAVCNAVYGLAQIFAALLALACVGSFKFGATWETGTLFIGILAGTVLLAWKYDGAIG
jgi:hypothetical protein